MISSRLDELSHHEIEAARFGSMSSDTSDDNSHASQESIFFRVVVNGSPKNIFIALEDLDFQDAHNLWEQIKQRLSAAGLTVEVLKKKLVAVCFDGASVNMGVLNGMQALVKRDIGEWVLVVHCVNHNFELALLDMKKEDTYLQEFEEIIKTLFKIYHWSPKLSRELQMLALLFEEEFEKFAALKNMRWSSSSFRAMHKLKNTYTNVSRHLEALAASNHKHSDTAKGILPKFRSVKFVKYLHFMVDFLKPCKTLSKLFQKEKVLITEIPGAIDRCLQELRSLSGGQGESMLEFGREYNSATKMFKGVKLQFTGRQTRAAQQRIDDVFVAEIPAEPVELVLYDSGFEGNDDSQSDSSSDDETALMTQHQAIFDEEIDNESEGDLEITEAEVQIQNELFSFFDSLIRIAIDYIKLRFTKFRQEPLKTFQEVFNVAMIRKLRGSKAIRRFARNDLDKVLQHFSPLFSADEIQDIKTEFTVFKRCVIQQKRDNLALSDFDLFSSVLKNKYAWKLTKFALMVELMFAISPSTAHVERSFSLMNVIKNKLRASLRQDMLNKSMTVALAQHKLDAEQVFDHWVELSNKGGDALVVGKVRLPNIFATKSKYRKNRHSKRKASQLIVLTSDSEAGNSDKSNSA